MVETRQIIKFFVDEFTAFGFNIGCYHDEDLNSIYCYLRKGKYKRLVVLSLVALHCVENIELFAWELIRQVVHEFNEVE